MSAINVFHISAECYPIAKVGGLADVVGALPRYQNDLGAKAKVVMPFYHTAYVKKNKFNSVFQGILRLGDTNINYNILVPEQNTLGFELYLVKVDGLLDRENVYSYGDDVERFTAFQIGALDWINQLTDKPDVVHCHDHHTGLIPFMMQYSYRYSALKNTPTVLTIHNGQYQGWFGFEKLYYIPAFSSEHTGMLDWGGTINPLAAAIKCVWRITTVSPTYLKELTFQANGLESLLAHETAKSIGILNGVDTQVWNPETDALLPVKYNTNTVEDGKRASKEALCQQFGLDASKPLFAFIGRLVHEKGTDILPEVLMQMLSSEANNANFLILGSGDPNTQEQLRKLEQWFPGNYNAYIGYDEGLSHLIYAGADFLMMPSRVEPCGLNQMYSLRYGTIPVVNSIGGLIDTVVDISEENGFGIRHYGVSSAPIIDAIFRAQQLFYNTNRFKQIRKQIMHIDHSWNASVKEYLKMYNNVINQKNG